MKRAIIRTLLLVISCMLWSILLCMLLPGDKYYWIKMVLGFLGGMGIAQLVSMKEV